MAPIIAEGTPRVVVFAVDHAVGVGPVHARLDAVGVGDGHGTEKTVAPSLRIEVVKAVPGPDLLAAGRELEDLIADDV